MDQPGKVANPAGGHAESGAYSRDSSRFPRRRSFIYAFIRYRVSPEFIGYAIAYRWRSLPRVRRHRAISPQGFQHRVLPLHYHVPTNVRFSFPTPTTGRPDSSEAPRNPLTRWDVSSIPANGIFLTKKLENKNKNAQRVEND